MPARVSRAVLTVGRCLLLILRKVFTPLSTEFRRVVRGQSVNHLVGSPGTTFGLCFLRSRNRIFMYVKHNLTRFKALMRCLSCECFQLKLIITSRKVTMRQINLIKSVRDLG
jgi:hypothetical protein